MYGKIFAKIYEGTLYGKWEALVTFQQMIVLCDADGMIDMTPQAIASRTSIPLEIIEKGIAVLEAPDPYSRTPEQEGRRIERIDAHRPWGWHIVNHAKYAALQDAETVRAQTRERVRKHRAAKALADDAVTVTDGNGRKRHTDTDTDTKTRKNTPPYSGAFLRFWGAWPKSSRKGERPACWEKWRKNDFDLIAEEIIAHVEASKRTEDWAKEGGKFIPAPLVYLNKRRWDGAESEQASGELRVAMP